MHDRAGRSLGHPPRATRRRHATLRRWVAAVVVVAVGVAGAAASGRELVAAWRDESTARSLEAVARSGGDAASRELASRRVELVAADLDLAAAGDRLATSTAGLAAAAADRDALVAALEQTRVDLTALRGAVAGARSAAREQAQLLESLGTCLDGVSRLINQISVGDAAGADRTVRAIGPSCSVIGMVLG